MIIKFWLQMDDEITEVTHEHPGMILLLDNGYSQVISDFASFLVAVGFDPLTVDNAFESREPYFQEPPTESERTEFLQRAFKPAEWTPETAKSMNDSAEIVQNAIDRAKERAESERGPQWEEFDPK